MMNGKVRHFYRKMEPDFEFCFNIETAEALTEVELGVLRWLLAETFESEKLSDKSFLTDRNVVEFGPRLNFATAFSSNAVSVCHSIGLTKITRIERSKRYAGQRAINAGCDRMTEMEYPEPISSFQTGLKPELAFYVSTLEQGVVAIHKINQDLGLSMVIDEKDVSKFIFEAAGFGIRAKKAGMIVEKQTYHVKINSKFNGEIVTF